MKNEELVKQALEGVNEKKEPEVKMIYDPETGCRLGLAHFQKVQIDTLGFMTLGEKVQKILTGSMDFRAQDRELEFDEEEGKWNDPEPDYDPTNVMLDKTDVHDLHKELLEELAQKQVNESHVTQVLPVDDLKALNKAVSSQSEPQPTSVSASAESTENL